MSFIHDDFLLETESARRLYHEYAVDQPILDYHTHLPPNDIAENRQFANLYEIWLEGDHYKWRAMRANGVGEAFCTGEAEPYDKYLAWARTVPKTLRNPLYHWSHLELKRYFDVDDLLSETTAAAVWEQANERLKDPALSTVEILKRFRVMAVCTTDDPTDDLRFHQQIAAADIPTRVYPTFRPDKSLMVDQPDHFNTWCDRLAEVTDRDIDSLEALEDALNQRHEYFHSLGGRLSDHGMPHCYASFCDPAIAAAIFDKARVGRVVSPDEHRQFATHMMVLFGRWDAQRGWTKQMHIGPMRNTNSRAFAKVGPDAGFDSMGDWNQADAMRAYLDFLDREEALPKTIVYNLNPKDNYLFASMVGNFQDGTTPGKMQIGSGWWYLDQKEGMTWQLNALSNVGLLSRFVGMLTDSRSFLSCPRHEYFRRILCNLLGNEMESGELPPDFGLVGHMVADICYANARDFFGLDLPSELSR